MNPIWDFIKHSKTLNKIINIYLVVVNSYYGIMLIFKIFIINQKWKIDNY